MSNCFTHAVKDGSMTKLSDYLAQFLGSEPQDNDVTYELRRIAELEEKLTTLRMFTEEAANAAAAERNAEARASIASRNETYRTVRLRYDALQQKLHTWVSPLGCEQVYRSACGELSNGKEFDTYPETPFVPITGKQWLEDQIDCKERALSNSLTALKTAQRNYAARKLYYRNLKDEIERLRSIGE